MVQKYSTEELTSVLTTHKIISLICKIIKQQKPIHAKASEQMTAVHLRV